MDCASPIGEGLGRDSKAFRFPSSSLCPAPVIADLIDGIHSIRLTNGSAANLIRQAFDGVGELGRTDARSPSRPSRPSVRRPCSRSCRGSCCAPIWLTLCPICRDLRPDGLQLFDDGARLAFLFRGFEVGARLVRLDQVTRDADAFTMSAAAPGSTSESLVGNADEDPPAAGPSRPVLLVPAHGGWLTVLSVFSDVAAVSPFALPDVAGDVKTTVAAPLRRRPKAFGARVKVHREGAVEGESVLCAQTV